MAETTTDRLDEVTRERDRLATQLSDVWLYCTGVVCTAEEGPEGDDVPALVKELREVCEVAQERGDALEWERDAAWDLFGDAAYVDGERKPLVECVESLIGVASKLSGLIDDRARLSRADTVQRQALHTALAWLQHLKPTAPANGPLDVDGTLAEAIEAIAFTLETPNV